MIFQNLIFINFAFVFKNSYKNFPDGTVHIIGVNEELSNENQHLAKEIDNQFIIGPDNGIFSLIFDEIFPDKIVELNIPLESDIMTFSIKDVFVKKPVILSEVELLK